MTETCKLGGIQVNEVEEWMKCIESGQYSVIRSKGDWAWTISIATGKSAPIIIEFNKYAQHVAIYRWDWLKEREPVLNALNQAWNKWKGEKTT